MPIVKYFDLYLNAGVSVAPVIHANQYDKTEQWVFTLYEENGTKYTPSTGAIIGIKADDKGILNTATVNSSGQVVVNETRQMTAAAGTAIFELLIDSSEHGTANFKVEVEPRPADNADMSDSDYSLLQNAVHSAEEILDIIGDTDLEEVVAEDINAWMDAHPEATTTVEDGAITAPKINTSLWDKLLVNESGSGTVASFNDGADGVPVKSLKVALEPVQLGSGDPSPSNVRPIIAANGKNMMPSGTDGTYTSRGITCVCEGGVYKLTGTSTESTTITIPLVASVDLSPSTNKIAFMNTQASTLEIGFCRSGTRIHYWALNTLNRVASGWSDSGNEVVDSVRFTVPNGATLDCTVSPMLMLLSDDDYSYQPYQSIVVKRTGKNLYVGSPSFDGYSRRGFYTKESETYNGHEVISRSTSWNGVYYPIKVTGGKTYTFSAMVKCDAYADVAIYEKTVAGGSSKSFRVGTEWQKISLTVTPNTDSEEQFRIESTTNTKIYLSEYQLEEGLEASEYEPYHINTYAIDLGDARYGGELDVSTGVLTVEKVAVDLGTFTWTAQTDSQGQYFKNVLTPEGRVSLRENICSCYSVVSSANVGDGNIAMGVTGKVLYVRDTRFTDAATFKTGITGQMFVYLLATPITVQLTPKQVTSLLGVNHISADCGDVEVTYRADTKLYIDSLTEPDSDMVADMNIPSGKYFIVNNHLYLSTTAIAQGDSIVVGMNCTETNLAEALNALNA